MNQNPACPHGYLPLTARWSAPSGTGETSLFIEATNYTDAKAAVREWFNGPAWSGYELLSLNR